jgi:hypothetical protein
MRHSKFPRRSDMVAIKLKHVVEDTDRHGNIRHYFRRKGQPKIRLRGIPCSDEFMEAYRAALANAEQTPQQRNMRTAAGSLGYICLNYYASPTFKALDPSTRHQRSYFLDSICEMYGDKPVSRMESRHVKMLLEKRRQTQQQPGIFLRLCRLYSSGQWIIRRPRITRPSTLSPFLIPRKAITVGPQKR